MLIYSLHYKAVVECSLYFLFIIGTKTAEKKKNNRFKLKPKLCDLVLFFYKRAEVF